MARRLDQALVEAGLAPSRARARAMIAAGAVRLDGAKATRPAQPAPPGTAIEITGDPLPYVSRAAFKLRHALERFGLSPRGAVALDLGASTGGFTQVLLEAGAAEVHAIDVGHGQMAAVLRADSRVHITEGLNARDLTAAHAPPPDWIVADLSFIALAKALPPALGLARPGATLVALVKPQFEVGPAHVGKGGLVRDPAAIEAALRGVRTFLETAGWRIIGEDESPILGGGGAREHLIAARKPGAG